MPRLSAAQWTASSLPRRLAVLVRARVLGMTGSAALFGGLLAALAHLDAGTPLRAVDWGLCLLGLLLAHASNNLLNDWTDHRRGLDAGDYFRMRYGSHPLAEGRIGARAFLAWMWAFGLAALAVGLALLVRTGPLLLPPFLAGAAVLLLYTWPMKTLGLGELAVLLVWGPLMVTGTFLVATGGAEPDVLAPILAGTLFGIGPTLVILGKHIDKADADAARGVRTLPVRLGERRARGLVAGLAVGQYPLLALAVAAGMLPWPALAAFASVPAARHLIRMCRTPRPAERPAHWPESLWPLWFVAAAFRLAGSFGLWLVLGTGIGVLLLLA